MVDRIQTFLVDGRRYVGRWCDERYDWLGLAIASLPVVESLFAMARPINFDSNERQIMAAPLSIWDEGTLYIGLVFGLCVCLGC